MPLRRTVTLLGLGLACWVWTQGCGPRPEYGSGVSSAGDRRSSSAEVSAVVLVSIDTLRADRLPAWGYRGTATPHLDAFRREAILFESAWSHIPLTLPSHTSVMTGLLPAEHGVRDNVGYRLSAETPTLAEILGRNGWRTAGAVSAAPLHSRTGLGAGFDVYDDRLEAEIGTGLGEVQRSGLATLAAIRPWLRGRPSELVADRKAFLFFHLFEPHTPYDPPEDLAALYGQTYDGEVAAADVVFGALRSELESVGLWQQAAVFVFSDHGEGLGDHGEDEHGVLLYREALHVPLLLKLPGGAQAGATVEGNVQLTDIFPTVLRLADLPDPRPTGSPRLRGRALLDEQWRPIAAHAASDCEIVAETFYPRIHFGWSELVSVVNGNHHFIQGATSELYDLAEDPAEVTDLRATERRTAAALQERVVAYDVAWSPPSALDEEQRAQLAALGYVSATVPDGAGPRPDPKSQLHVLRALQQGATAYRDQDYRRAVAILEPLLEDHPQMADGWTVLGHSFNNLDRRKQALAAYLRGLDLLGASPGVAAPAATLLAEDGELTAAFDLLRAQIELAPSSRRLRRLEVRLLVQSEALQEARQRLDDWLVFRPGEVEALYQRGIVQMLTGRYTEAETDLRNCLDLSPDYAPALHDLGVLLLRGGRVEEARDLVRRALEADPDHPLAAQTLERIERALRSSSG